MSVPSPPISGCRLRFRMRAAAASAASKLTDVPSIAGAAAGTARA